MPVIKTPKTVGAKIDLMAKLDDQRKEYDELAKGLKNDYNIIEAALMEQMGREDITISSASLGSVKIGDSVVPNVKDWDLFYKFIAKMKYYHLLERRPSVSGCRELFETKGSIPGVEAFVKIKLTLTHKRK